MFPGHGVILVGSLRKKDSTIILKQKIPPAQPFFNKLINQEFLMF